MVLNNLSEDFWDYFDPIEIEYRMFYGRYSTSGEFENEIKDFVFNDDLKEKLIEESKIMVIWNENRKNVGMIIKKH